MLVFFWQTIKVVVTLYFRKDFFLFSPLDLTVFPFVGVSTIFTPAYLSYTHLSHGLFIAWDPPVHPQNLLM